MTPAALLISLAGLSQPEASAFLGIGLSAVQSWHRKTKPSLAGRHHIDALVGLIAKQEQAAEEMLALIEASGADKVEIGYPADDHEAQALGWPCVGAWAGMAARVIAQAQVPVRMAPRGSTLVLAATADAHKL